MAARLPESSAAWFRSVLDPAHATEYHPAGIPDNYSTPTLPRQVNSIIPLQTKPGATFYYWANNAVQTTNSPTTYTVRSYNIILNECACDDVIVLILCKIQVSNNSYDAFTITRTYNQATVDALKDNQYRLVSKGVTIREVGQQMYRGGYFSCHRMNSTWAFDSTSDTPYWAIDVDKFTQNLLEMYPSSQGVYAVLQPDIMANMGKMRRIDGQSKLIVDFEEHRYEIPWNNTPTMPDLPGWKCQLIRYIPPMTVTPDSVDTFALQMHVYSTLEIVKDTDDGGNNTVTYDPYTLNLVGSLSEHTHMFYPGSYNDLQKIMNKLKEVYNQHSDVIDLAVGMLPYGSTIRSVLNVLMKPSKQRSGKRQLTRTRA